MKEITIKLEVPSQLKEKIESAIAKAIRNFEIDLEFAIADAITSKSRLTEEQVRELANELKKRVASRHKM